MSPHVCGTHSFFDLACVDRRFHGRDHAWKKDHNDFPEARCDQKRKARCKYTDANHQFVLDPFDPRIYYIEGFD